MGFEDRVLFHNINLGLQPGERLALIGANGCGKTTLLRLITGDLEPEHGQVILGKHVKLGYSQQESKLSGKSIYEEALAVFEPLMAIERELAQVTQELQKNHSEALLSRQAQLQESLDRQDGATFRARTRSALVGLGFPESEHGRPAAQLSGGQQAKLRLGRLLLSKADLLLLDEPTNHLDLNALAWLEEFLRSWSGAVIMVSHDRRFLDNVATKTALLHHARLDVYKGGYSQALKKMAEKAEQDRRNYDNQMAEIRRIEGIIEQQKRFNQERNYVTIASKQKQIDRLKAQLVAPDANLRNLRFRFPPVMPTGNEVLRLRGLGKRFGEKELFRDATGLIEKGERAFILGPNGCGKTTLLRILRKELAAEQGYFAWGAGVKTGYYDQNLIIGSHNQAPTGFSTEKTVLDEVWDSFRTLTQTEVRNMLGLFLFGGDDVFKQVDKLSGGERARIALMKLLLSGTNVLLLDEPTNHLDIPSREALETALLQFEGTIIAVSHDRHFIAKLATKCYVLLQNGLQSCGESYDDFIAKDTTKLAPAKERKPPNEYQQKKLDAIEARKRKAELNRCETEIAQLEDEIASLHAQLTQHAADYTKLIALGEALKEKETALEQAMQTWECLADA